MPLHCRLERLLEDLAELLEEPLVELLSYWSRLPNWPADLHC